MSAEFWEGFRRREQSIFVDLFYGQLKSRVQCQVCGKVSITFDPFNMLSLPIPHAQKDLKVSIKYYPRSLLSKPKEFLIQVGEYATLNEVKSRIVENLPKEQCEDLPFIARIKNKCVDEMLDKEKFMKSYIERGDEIVAFERIALPENSNGRFFLLEVKIVQPRKSYMLFTSIQPIAQSRLFIADKRWTVKQVKLEIFKLFRPLFPSRNG